MAIRIKDFTEKESPLTNGHRMCPGCGAPTAVHQGLMGVESPVVVVNATGCLEVSTTVYPVSSWRVPWIHTAFENAGAGVSGVEGLRIPEGLGLLGRVPEDSALREHDVRGMTVFELEGSQALDAVRECLSAWEVG